MALPKSVIAKLNLLPFILVGSIFLISLTVIVSYSLFELNDKGEIIYELSLANYRRIFSDTIYLNVFFRSFVMAGTATAICLAAAYPFAYFIARKNYFVRTVALIALLLPFSANFLIRTYAWIFILRTDGVLDRIASIIDLQYGNLLFSGTAVVIGLVYNYLVFMILPIYASLIQFDFQLLKASDDLGATKIKTFFFVTLPASRIGILTGIGLVFISSLGDFVVPDLVGGAKSLMIGNLIKLQFLGARNWPFGAALTVVLVIVVVAVVTTLAVIWSSWGSTARSYFHE